MGQARPQVPVHENEPPLSGDGHDRMRIAAGQGRSTPCGGLKREAIIPRQWGGDTLEAPGQRHGLPQIPAARAAGDDIAA